MKCIESLGKTVDEAVKKALSELKVTEDKVEIKVIDEGSKGLLNIIGKREAKVKVTLKTDYIDEVRTFLRKVFEDMNLVIEIKIKEIGNDLFVNLFGKNIGLLIGYRGETLDSLQYLVNLVANKNHADGKYKRVILDTENYRAKREETLKRLALKISKRVKEEKSPFKLEPMNPYERRVIHSALQNDKYVRTYSEGEEPHRRVVVELKKS
ncbi:spoIIIJ-associated protein [Clostridium acetobutylicum]|uniref:RNA-binding protein KhpB n=1 Tax=Clostridium acetobutylicum (strain ATCC 824 / DSM 792 / JCM 1419 / IAM 19013 / LMG 5710 / NBRC 13948 / NRRL B-527 / VKM B-1787 / 2291 / W) TaxID=272562 RepID=Q97CW1_CLOAB|nr:MULTISPECIES: RNA-binding cell elongation regulator Jag/EloR [Clostridium]AAK81655.1 Predicted RNA-binding protein Jag, SpoIIIJ-associated [Clostridium acetobutylicum ATCC 824]ADZ22779.1 RNA-binding protein Jag, SpoIIIJ-associated [Clostridium acetobutylicum EA 2018]AEI33697.1 RNA-binding protein Jag, SpoIIIJ-associated [Clostridium acetobutylicum DSM 1731]AWV80671.1 protein jag [Clostridium acetobutylicum]KHD34496.1 DNA-binding protein [Clostridium acetobutylicum]